MTYAFSAKSLDVGTERQALSLDTVRSRSHDDGKVGVAKDYDDEEAYIVNRYP
jgi:hypothetical protein